MNSLEDKTIADQLRQLRAFTARYGVLHEGHLLQLKIWPRVTFPTSVSSVATVDQGGRNVQICVKFKGKLPELKERIAATAKLCVAVQWLLGEDWAVKVFGEFFDGARVAIGARAAVVPENSTDDEPEMPPLRWDRPEV